MAEVLTALTVQGAWHNQSVGVEPFEKVVGVITPEDKEVLLPESPSDYWSRRGGYHEGYSKKDITERPLPLGPATSEKLTQFFEHFLLTLGWRDKGSFSECYDCHWVANWLTGAITEKTSTRTSLAMSEAIILNGKKTEEPLTREQIGVIGGLSLQREEPYALATHSFVALDETSALQAAGVHGAIAIARQTDIVKYYRETAWFVPISIERDGLHVFSTAQ